MNDQELLDASLEKILRVLPPLYRWMQAQRLKISKEMDLSRGQWEVLTALARDSGLSATELSQQLGIAKSNLVTTIDWLVARGLVEKGLHPHGGRSVALVVTDAGNALYQELRARFRELTAQGLAELDDATLRLVLAGLDALDPLSTALTKLSG